MSISSGNVIQTVLSINSPLTTNDERVRCTQMIETLKEGCPDVIANVGFELVNKSDPFLSHVGWTFIEDLIRYKWNQLTSDYRLELRSRILQLIEVQLTENTIESNARCVVAMMEHEWPQNWGELVIQLEQLSTRNNAGLLAAKYIICWLSDVCEWVTLSALEPLMNQIIDTVIRYLNIAERSIYEQAALCLAALAGRKNLAADVAHSSEEHYKYLKALCNLLTILGIFTLDHLARVWIDKTPPQNFSTYLSAIVAFFIHPSLHLKNEACDVLIALSTHSVFKDDSVFKAVISEVLGKVGCPSKLPRTPATHYSLMDYDDDVEWQNTFLRGLYNLHYT
uniref:Importin N-terminal domain-containing protein n=1 Tax=Heterorhabditis bacteriophora TaxID=37862 RepID=A0A1I7XLD2_HETBA